MCDIDFKVRPMVLEYDSMEYPTHESAGLLTRR